MSLSPGYCRLRCRLLHWADKRISPNDNPVQFPGFLICPCNGTEMEFSFPLQSLDIEALKESFNLLISLRT